MSLGEIPLARPVVGEWTVAGYPEYVLVGGRVFRRARLKQAYPGVVEQYRAATEQNSAHLKVLQDGRWVIDHVDGDNPDMGRPLQHFFNDHPVGKGLKVAAVGAGVVAGAYMTAKAVTALFGYCRRAA